LDQELDHLFQGMVNVTDPTAQMGQRRGVLAGGNVTIRNRIQTLNPISMTPPSVAGGCSGIDLYAGSFSFINQDQFVALLRSIASNAGGYAFQLGINALCPDCGSLMSDLQKKVQTLNQHFANSCQLAQGLVNDGLSAMGAQQQNRLSQISLASGVGDVFQSWTQAGASGLNVAVNANPAAVQSTLTGNLIWRALNQSQASTTYAFGGTDLLETIMSVTGTLIIQLPSGTASTQPMPVVRLPPLIGVRELLNGNTVQPGGSTTAQRYQCDNLDPNGCLHPRQIPLDVEGYMSRLTTLLVGPEGNTGLLAKFATGQGDLTTQEIGFMALAPSALGALLRNLSREDPSLARLFANQAGPILAVDLVSELLEGMAVTAREAGKLNDHAYQPMVNQAIQEALDDLRVERERLDQRYGRMEALIRHYEGLMQQGKPRDYGVGNPLSGGARRGSVP
jgi:conjugative transfer pilus assembly protein TraH